MKGTQKAVRSELPEGTELRVTELGRGTPGITPVFGSALAEATSVCLADQGHASPTSMLVEGALSGHVTLCWSTPDEQAKRCWADDEVATEHAAYGVATLLVPRVSDLTVVLRSKKGTGFDYWLGGQDDEGPLFQNKARLEVSGIRNGSAAAVNTRVTQKLRQTARSEGLLPAVVVVVEFGEPQSRVAER